MTTTTATGTSTGTPTGGEFVSIAEAVRVTGLTERSVRRGIASGKFLSAMQGGRRVVRVDVKNRGEPDATPDRHATGGGDVELKPAATGGGMTTTTEVIELILAGFERNAEFQRNDTRRARRQARTSWIIAAAAGLALSVGAIWGVQAVERARGQALASDAARAILVEQLSVERERGRGMQVKADQLAGELLGVRLRQALAGVPDLIP